jgi:hypothetical protein
MIPTEISDALRLGYPTSKYTEVSHARLDAGPSGEDLAGVAEELGRSGLVTTHVEGPQQRDDRSGLIVVGLQDCPTWGRLTAMAVKDRIKAIEHAGGLLHYLKVYVSRLGPFWMCAWNGFRIADYEVAIELLPPRSPQWTSARSFVDATLRKHGLTEIPESILAEPVPWLDSTGAWTLRSAEVGGAPTVYECLFSDIY